MAAASPFAPNGGASSTPTPAGFRHRHDKIAAPTPSARPLLEGSETATRRRIRSDHRLSTPAGWNFRQSGWVKEGFRQFGEHCARNQIRTLLLDCIVMTNLFYPALAVYLQKRDPHPVLTPSPSAHLTHRTSARFQRHKDGQDPLAVLTSPLLDNLFPYPPPLLPRLSWGGWWGRYSGQETRAGWIGSQVKHGDGSPEEEIWLMRVAWADVGDILDRRPFDLAVNRSWTERDEMLLNFVRDTAEDWGRPGPEPREVCVRQAVGSSPTGNYLLSNQSTTPLADLLDFSAKDHPSPAHPTVPNAVWGSRESSIYRSVAVPFHVDKRNANGFQDRWSDAVTRFTRDLGGEVYIEAEALRRDLHDWVARWSVSYYVPQQVDAGGGNADEDAMADTFSSRWVMVVFLVLIAVLSAQISFATKVHSRFGLAFTGIVQLCCSSVMSLSVLALLGWNGWGKSEVQATLPTYILPFVIVVVGVENMSTLVKAVFSVPFSHSVPVRIGLGLAKVGMTIALTSLTDLLLLGIICLCVNLRPVREFCLFAAVVIITDWFMLHTFFLTVLSIDAQRLELADVLAGTGGVATPVEDSPSATVEAQKSSGKGRFDWRKLLRARMTKSFSLVLLLLVVVALYYQSGRQRGSGGTTASLYGYNPSWNGRQPGVITSLTDTNRNMSDVSTGERFWRAINPQSIGAVRVVIPAATILAMPRPGHFMSPGDIRHLAISPARLLFPRLKPLFFFFKIMILPQAATAGVLYGLLLFLLKNSELLDAQRNKLGRGEVDHFMDESSDTQLDLPIESHTARVIDEVNVRILPGSHPSDIDFVASSRDGRTVLSVGVDSTISLWRLADDSGYQGTREILSATSLGSPVVAVAVNDDGKWISLAGSRGKILAWEVLQDRMPVLQPILAIPSEEGLGIDSIAFFAEAQESSNPFRSSMPLPGPTALPSISVSFDNGKVVIVDSSGKAQTVVGPSSSASDVSYRMDFKRSDTEGRPDAGYLESSPLGSIFRKSNTAEWSASSIESTLGTEDPVSAATAKTAQTRDGPLNIIALGHVTGAVELVNPTGGLLATVGGASGMGPVVKLDVGAPATCRCSSCGSTVYDSFIVASANSELIFIDQVRPRSTTLCRCSVPRRSNIDDAGKPKPSNRSSPSKSSLVIPPMLTRGNISPGPSPRKSPSLLPPISNGDFPLSSHGAARRMSIMSITGNAHREEVANRPPSSPKEHPVSVAMSLTSSGSRIRQEYDVQPLGAISAPKCSSSWAIIRNTIVGVRRTGNGIDDSQWQVWTIDLSAPWNGHSLNVETASLSHLAIKTHRSIPRPATSSPGGISVQDRRAERALSMIGRSAFPALGRGSISVPTYAPLAYVTIRPYVKCGESIVAGFGNRLGIISLPHKADKEGTGLSRGASGKRASNVDLGVRAPPPKRSFEADVERKKA